MFELDSIQIKSITNMRTKIKYIALEDVIDALRYDLEQCTLDEIEAKRYIAYLIERFKELR